MRMLHLTIIGVVLLSALLASADTSASPDDTTAFLMQQAAAINLDLPDGGLPENAIDVEGKRLFLLGETHGVAANYAIDLALLRYFHRAAAVRVYLMEFSHAHAQFINQYLDTGEEQPLDFTLEQLHGYTDGSMERRNFFTALRVWNQSLPPQDRVTVIGFDVERMPGISLAYMQQLLSTHDLPPQLLQLSQQLANLPQRPTLADARSTIESLEQYVAAHRTTCESLLGDHWFDFELAMDNLTDRIRVTADRAQYNQMRDAAQLRNFQRLSAHVPFTRAYGRCGSAHVLQQSTGGIEHFSALLQKDDSPWRGQVVSIWPLYAAGERVSFADGRYGTAPCADDANETRPFISAAPGEVTLFRLTDDDSPFAKQLLLPGEAAEGVTTDYFQYVLLVKSATAATPFHHEWSGDAAP
ncbi:MAG: erythromycin esterase family protein [Phycisphaeraceae bacterium]|nr:erythromycin esterase family protein [Phycisphaeraceae bacterium]